MKAGSFSSMPLQFEIARSASAVSSIALLYFRIGWPGMPERTCIWGRQLCFSHHYYHAPAKVTISQGECLFMKWLAPNNPASALMIEHGAFQHPMPCVSVTGQQANEIHHAVYRTRGSPALHDGF